MLTFLLSLLAITAVAEPINLDTRQLSPGPAPYLLRLKQWRRELCLGTTSATSGANVTIQSCTSPNTRWRFYHVCPYSATWFQLEGTNLCLTAGVGSRHGQQWQNGDPEYLTPCVGDWPTACSEASRAQWTLLYGQGADVTADMTFAFGGSRSCLDVDGGGGIGAKVQVWDCHPYDHADYWNQRWQPF